MNTSDPRDESLTDRIATIIQEGHTAKLTSHEIAIGVMEFLSTCTMQPAK